MPRGKQLVLFPRGNQYHQLVVTSSSVDFSLFNVQCPWRSQLLLCPMGNSVSPLGPEIASLVDIILFNVESPRGSQLVLFPRENQYHQLAITYYHQWTGHCLMFSAPWEFNCYCAPGELSITKWPWNNITSGHHIVKFRVPPGKSTLVLIARGNQYHQLPLKYCHQRTSYYLMLSAQEGVSCCCAPGKLSITNWPWNSITSGHHIV